MISPTTHRTTRGVYRRATSRPLQPTAPRTESTAALRPVPYNPPHHARSLPSRYVPSPTTHRTTRGVYRRATSRPLQPTAPRAESTVALRPVPYNPPHHARSLPSRYVPSPTTHRTTRGVYRRATSRPLQPTAPRAESTAALRPVPYNPPHHARSLPPRYVPSPTTHRTTRGVYRRATSRPLQPTAPRAESTVALRPVPYNPPHHARSLPPRYVPSPTTHRTTRGVYRRATSRPLQPTAPQAESTVALRPVPY